MYVKVKSPTHTAKSTASIRRRWPRLRHSKTYTAKDHPKRAALARTIGEIRAAGYTCDGCPLRVRLLPHTVMFSPLSDFTPASAVWAAAVAVASID
jgi:hypothetical protein